MIFGLYFRSSDKDKTSYFKPKALLLVQVHDLLSADLQKDQSLTSIARIREGMETLEE
jgi:hypothetical protein